MTLISKHQ